MRRAGPVLAVVGSLAAGLVGYGLGKRGTVAPDDLARPGATPESAGDAVVRERDELRREVAALRSQRGAARGAVPEGSDRAEAVPAAQPPALELRAQAKALMQPWVVDARQVRDERVRDAALASIQEALGSEKPEHVLAGILAFRALWGTTVDRSSFRTSLAACLESPEPAVRQEAVTAFLAAGTKAEDVPVFLRLLRDDSADVRRAALFPLAVAARGELTGEVGAAILGAVEGMPPKEASRILRNLPWSRASPELEARVLALAREPEARRDVIWFQIVHIDPKTEAMVDLLLEAVRDSDPEIRKCARWGLATGIPDSCAPRVAAALMESLEIDGGAEENIHHTFNGLRRYGTASEALALERFAQNPLVPEEVRKQAKQAAEEIQRRLRR